MSIFSWKKKAESVYRFSNIGQDIHSHILPGLDDGSPDIGTSLELVRALSEAGINRLICTPHIIADIYRNTPEHINAALAILKRACAENGLHTNISAAAEYMLDDHFMELIRTKQPLLTLKKNYILTELSYAMLPNNLEQIAFEININDYQPLMAHPERYHYYHGNYQAYYRLKDLGFSLQVNLLSLTGHYGKAVARAADYLFKNDLVDFVGSDIHHIGHIELLRESGNRNIIQKYLGDRIYNVF
ncbi:MAG: CpsB/CapC family capsule biosynthesis tyrosine phosphatase [Ginsengibacter sp.]